VGTYEDAGFFSGGTDAGGADRASALRVAITPAAPTVCPG
jgi:hypothetical protein